MRKLLPITSVLLLLVVCQLPVAAAEQGKILLEPLIKRLTAARASHLDLLTPQSFERAAQALANAEAKLERGKSLEAIEAALRKADLALDKAEESRKTAELTLSDGMEAREDALLVTANENDQRAWSKAEELLVKAAVTLEKGNVKAAQNRTAAAVAAYRELELQAIKSNYLAEGAKLIEQAKQNNVKKYAPKTLAKAEQLLAEAEQALNSDRYDTDRPRSLARSAKYEALHSLYIAGVLEQQRENRDVTVEDLALQWEKPLQQIAGELDIVIDMSNGSVQPVSDITQAIGNLKAQLLDLGLELDEKNQQLMLAQGQMQEKFALEVQVQRQNEARARFDRVQKMFAPDEAQVLRQGDEVTIRLPGLSFDSGKSVINSEDFSMLSKVQQAIQLYPDSELIVEGHTDSFGGDVANQKLSQLRAEAVRAYLLANMSLDPASIDARGFGESRPIANNESAAGRAKNRRIDLVITGSALAGR